MASDHAYRAGVSFVTAIYNKEPYLPAVLDALKHQQGDFEREYIFIDDGSTDDSLEIVRDLTAGWLDVTILEQENYGSAFAINRGIDRASHPFIKFCDADDVLAHGATQCLLDSLVRTEACLAYGRWTTYESVDDLNLDQPLLNPDVSLLSHPLKTTLRNAPFRQSSVLVRTECSRMVGGGDERLVYSQDYSLALRLALRWPFVRVAATMIYCPPIAPSNISSNEGRQLQRVSLACANFLRDYPDVSSSLQRFACNRAAGRAWKWQRRHRGAGFVSKWFWRYYKSYLTSPRDAPAFIEACAQAFEDEPAMTPATVSESRAM